MMRPAATAIVALLVATSAMSAPGFSSFNMAKEKKVRVRTVDPALFRFLPGPISASEECTGAALGSTKGAVTHTRASSGVCSKSDGTLVTMLTDVPRLQGTGILSEQTATNKAIRNTAFNNPAWTGTNVAAISADTDGDPFGTTTAEYVCTTSAGGFIESTAFATGAVGTAVSVYAKTRTGTQAAAIRLRDTSAGSDKCTGTFTADDTWLGNRQNCHVQTGLNTTNNHTLRIYPGGTAGEGCLVLYGAQAESYGSNASQVSSLIITDGAAATRAGDSYSVANTGVNNLKLTAYFSATVTPPTGGTQGYFFYAPDGVSTSHNHFGSSGPVNQCNFLDASTNPTVNSVATLNRGAENTISCEYTGTSIISCVNGACTTANFTFNVDPNGRLYNTFFLARGTAITNAFKGTVRKICVSNTKADCL